MLVPAYSFMLSEGVVLLPVSTVQTWIGKSKFLPGFNKFSWENLAKKFENEDEKTMK